MCVNREFNSADIVQALEQISEEALATALADARDEAAFDETMRDALASPEAQVSLERIALHSTTQTRSLGHNHGQNLSDPLVSKAT